MHVTLRYSVAAWWGMRLSIVIALVWISSIAIGFTHALSLLTLVGFIAAIAGVRVPVLGLFGVGLLVVLDPIARHLLLGSGGWLRWNTFNYWLLLTSILFLPRVWRLHDLHSRLLRLLILVIAVDLFVAQSWEAGLQTLINISTVFALVIYFQRAMGDPDSLFWLGATTGLAAALGGVSFYREMDLLTAMNKNAFAMFPLAGVFGACIGFPFATRFRGGQLILASLAAVDVAWVFLSRSRGAMVLALIGMMFLIAAAKNMTTRLVYLGAVLAVGIVLASRFGALEEGAAARFDKLFNADVSLEERTSGRSVLMRGGWSIFLQHPLGIGTGGFENAWAALEQPETVTQWAAGKQVPAHSGWLMVLVENGLPGITLFVSYVVSFAIVGLRQRDRRLLLLGLFVTVMLAVAFTMNEFQGKALWFAAAAATALMHPEALGMTMPARRRGVRSRPLFELVLADV